MSGLDGLPVISVPRILVEERGEPGHFVGARSCWWRRHTHVNGYCISSVGEYFPGETMVRLDGAGSGDHPPAYYETMVYRVLPDDRTEDVEIDSCRWQEREEANLGHNAMVSKWATR